MASQDELNVIALILTGLIVFWSTRDAYDLKQSANKELARLDAAEKNKFLPIITPTPGGGVLELDGKVQAKLMNIGLGIAQEVCVEIRTIGASRHSFASIIWGPHIMRNQDTKSLDIRDPATKAALVKLIAPENRPKQLVLEIRYQDIFGRLHRTTAIHLDYQTANTT